MKHLYIKLIIGCKNKENPETPEKYPKILVFLTQNLQKY